MLYHADSLDDLYRELSTGQDGLSKSEAESRLKKDGPNLIVIEGEPLWRKLVEPFRSIFMLVLIVAAGISYYHHEPLEGSVIMVIVLINAVIYYVQRFSTEKIIRSLQKKNVATVSVMRGGTLVRVDSEKLVRGDVLSLEEGDKIPADARIISVRSCRVDESQLTGESLPIEKQPGSVAKDSEIYERTNMLYQGSFLVGGEAQAVIVATGNDTEFGKLAGLTGGPHQSTPVEKKIDKLVTQVIAGVSAIAVVTFLLALYRGIELSEALRFVMALAVSAVPEGLPIAITVILALGMRKMAQRKALVRNMAAIENTGAITTIATDKTGTLTKNLLSVKKIMPADTGTLASATKTLDLSTIAAAPGKVRDPLDTAFELFAPGEKNPMRSFAFEHTVAMSGNLYHYGNEFRLFVKGAPEKMIAASDLTDSERERALLQVNKLTSEGLRVIALGHLRLDKEIETLESLKRRQFTLDGFAGVADILRPEARGAIRQAHTAGISVRMITGDHFETAYQIGKELELVTSRSEVFDCRKMNVLSDKKLAEVIANTKVFSRVIPEQKHRILTILKQRDITAMTGDGVNDIPALTNAHVGFSMGSGAAIARDAGDIILLDDNFRSIVAAIKEGRTIYANIKRMVSYLLATNFGEVLVSLCSLIIGSPLPLTPIQLLWINIATDTCMVIPIGLEPADKKSMKEKPHAPDAPLLNRFTLVRTLIVALTMAVTTLSIFLIYLSTHSEEYARTLAFNALVVMQWASAFGFRSDTDYFAARLAVKHTAFYIGLGIAVTMQSLIMFTPLGVFVGVTPVAMMDLALTSLIAFIAPLAAIELHKSLYHTHRSYRTKRRRKRSAR